MYELRELGFSSFSVNYFLTASNKDNVDRRLYELVSLFLSDNSFDMSKVFGRNRSAADTLDSRTILLKFSANRSTVSCKLP